MEMLNRNDLSKWIIEKMNLGFTLSSKKGIINDERINVAWICNETKEKFILKYNNYEKIK